MRYLTTKPRPKEKRLIRQPLAATFSHRRRHICTPACSCLLLLEKGDRVAVDEECAFFPTNLPSAIPPLALPL